MKTTLILALSAICVSSAFADGTRPTSGYAPKYPREFRHGSHPEPTSNNTTSTSTPADLTNSTDQKRDFDVDLTNTTLPTNSSRPTYKPHTDKPRGHGSSKRFYSSICADSLAGDYYDNYATGPDYFDQGELDYLCGNASNNPYGPSACIEALFESTFNYTTDSLFTPQRWLVDFTYAPLRGSNPLPLGMGDLALLCRNANDTIDFPDKAECIYNALVDAGGYQRNQSVAYAAEYCSYLNSGASTLLPSASAILGIGAALNFLGGN